MEMVHKPHYSVAMQMMKKFVLKESVRPILNVVYHKANGDIVATDSHHLLMVKDVHGFKEEYLVNPKTFEFSTGQYPNTDKILPPRKEDTIILSSDEIKIWHQAHKSMKQMADSLEDMDNYHVKLLFGSQVYLKLCSEHEVMMNLPCEVYNAEIVKVLDMIGYNAAYMADAFEAMIKLKATTVKIQFCSQLAPFMLHNEDDSVMAMILPVRIYN